MHKLISLLPAILMSQEKISFVKKKKKSLQDSS